VKHTLQVGVDVADGGIQAAQDPSILQGWMLGTDAKPVHSSLSVLTSSKPHHTPIYFRKFSSGISFCRSQPTEVDKGLKEISIIFPQIALSEILQEMYGNFSVAN